MHFLHSSSSPAHVEEVIWEWRGTFQSSTPALHPLICTTIPIPSNTNENAMQMQSRRCGKCTIYPLPQSDGVDPVKTERRNSITVLTAAQGALYFNIKNRKAQRYRDLQTSRHVRLQQLSVSAICRQRRTTVSISTCEGDGERSPISCFRPMYSL